MNRGPWRFARMVIIACTLSAGSVAAQECMPPPDGIVSWWPGDGDALDIQSGLHGTAVNGATYGQGLVGEAFLFDGIGNGQDDLVDLPPSAVDGLTDLTFEMWVYSQSEQGTFLTAASWPVEGAYTDNEVTVVQGRRGTSVWIRQEQSEIFPGALADEAWHHLAYTRAGSIGTFYIDGILVDARTTPADPLEVGPGGLLMGQEQDCLGGCFDPIQALHGAVDELTIYDRALDEFEVLAIYEAGAAGKCKPITAEELLTREVEDLESDVAGLESEVATLQARVEELEATPPPACETVEDDDHHGRHDAHHRRSASRKDRNERGRHAWKHFRRTLREAWKQAWK